MRVVQERTWGGRLFQTVGAAMRKAREPNDKLDCAYVYMLVCYWQAIDRARDMVDTELTALAAESYSRAYGVSSAVFVYRYFDNQ